MNILLIGGGGREHALAWKLSQSAGLARLYAAPGNPGIADHAELVALDADDHATVIAFCREKSVELVVIGPEAPLVNGLADALRDAGLLAFGPGAAAARLEGSKGFTKDLCTRVGIPTAAFERCTGEADVARALTRFEAPWVVKADGLAAGKGVVIAHDNLTAFNAAMAAIEGGREVVVEEFLTGEEVSLFVLTDGVTALSLGSVQDHKRVGDGDTGPNTGGMGAYSPATVLPPALEARAIDEIVAPTLAALAAAGTPFSGVLYAGLMLTETGPQLIEYNVRFGDPEAQVLMLRLEDDLLDLMLATAQGRLAGRAAVSMNPNVALTVVMAAKGYPGVPESQGMVGGLAAAEARGAKVFQAATATREGQLVSCGGRVLAVSVLAADIVGAQNTAYAAVDAIDFPTGFFRRDIGWREVERLAR